MLACTEIIQIVEAREDLDQSADQPGYMAATLEKVCMVINQGLIVCQCIKVNGFCLPHQKIVLFFFSFPFIGLKNREQKFFKSSPLPENLCYKGRKEQNALHEMNYYLQRKFITRDNLSIPNVCQSLLNAQRHTLYNRA